MSEPIRVILADDHPLVRAGIRATLAAEMDIEVVEEACDGEEAQRLCVELEPDVLLLDLSMPGPGPLEVLNFLDEQCPAVRVIILTAHDDDAYVRRLLSAGVSGYLLKGEATESVVGAIRAVAQSGSWFSRTVVEKIAHWQVNARPAGTYDALTDREYEILRMVAQGWDNARIADELHLAEQTIRNYTSRIYHKLGVSSRGEAIIWAREQDAVT